MVGAWVVALLAVVLALRAGDSGARAAASSSTSRGIALAWLLPIAMAALVWWLDDRTWFTGDALLRRVPWTSGFASNFRNSTALERMIYGALAARWQAPDVTWIQRGTGAIAAAIMGACAVRCFARTRLAFSTRLAAILMIALGGALVTCTGLGRPSSLLCALTALTALWTGEHSQGTRRSAHIGATVAVAILLHRGGLLLLPPWILSLRAPAPEATSRSWSSRVLSLAATLLPIVALVFEGPSILGVILTTDLPNHILGASTAGMPAALDPATWALRAWDLGQLALLLCPLGVVLFFPEPAGADRPRGMIDRGMSLALVLPWCAAAILIRPQQGIFRDLDVFAAGSVALSFVAAARLAQWCSRSSRPARLACPAFALQLVGVLPLLVCFHLPSFGIARVTAYLEGPPLRSATERFHQLDFLAERTFLDEDWVRTKEFSAAATLLAPSPRLLLLRGIAEVSTGDDTSAERTFRTAALRAPEEQSAWLGLYGIAHRRGDKAMADSATTYLERTANGRLTGGALIAFRHFPQLVRGAPAH